MIQPLWTPEGKLLYIGDQSNWWNLYLVSDSGEHTNLHPVEAEIAGPQWWLGKTPYALEPTSNGGRILTSFGGVRNHFGSLISSSSKTKGLSKSDTLCKFLFIFVNFSHLHQRCVWRESIHIFRTSNLEFSPGEHLFRERSRKV